MKKRTTLLVDTETAWIHRPSDALGAALSVLAIGAILLLSIYASSTTLAVTADARHAADDVLRTVFVMPINVLEGLLAFFAPLAVLIELVWTQRFRALVTTLAAAGSAALIASLTAMALREYLPDSPITAILAFAIEGQSIAILVPYIAILAAIFTAAGTRSALVSIRWSWPILWAVLILSILQGQQTLPGALATVFLGMAVGQLVRFLIGDIPNRARGLSLIRLIRRTGIDATEIVRIGDINTDTLVAWRVNTSAPLGYREQFQLAQLQQLISKTFDPVDNPEDRTDAISVETLVNPHDVYENFSAFQIPYSETVSRHYIAIDTDGQAHHISVLDSDRHVLGKIMSTWSRIRLRVHYRRDDDSIHETADHVSLMTLSAQHAGVDVPDLEGVASSDESVVIASKLLRAPTLDQVATEEITDDVLDQLWMILDRAHASGLAHRNIHAGLLLLDDGELLVTNWHDGTIASSEVARKIDIAQGLATLTSLVGQERALDSCERMLGTDQLLTTGPLLQKTIMPKQTLATLDKKAFGHLREALTSRIPPTEEVAPVEMRRFSPRTVISVTVAMVAIYVLLGSINFSDVWAALKQADIFMLTLAAFGSFVTYVGAALHLKAYTPEKVPLGQSTVVQLAASIITLVVPAGIGPAALNLRYLNRKGVQTALGLATVSLVQITQFLTTVILLVGVALLTGDIGSLSLPSARTIIIVVVALAIIAGAFLIKPLRKWVFNKIGPTVDKVWPRVVWLVNHPERIALGAVGSLLQTVGYVAAFGFALNSLGYSLPVMTLAITFLVSNTVGSIVPSPGGIGPVEAALTGGLVVAGVPYSIALSTSLIYRLLTFWGPVPIGWFSLRYLQKRDLV